MVRVSFRVLAFLIALEMVGGGLGQGQQKTAPPSNTVLESHPNVVRFTIRRAPVPGSAAESRARAAARQLYGSDYSAAKTALNKSELAKRLLEESDTIKGDPTSRYVMLHIVIDMAAPSGNAETALAAVDRLIDEFDVDLVREKLPVLKVLAKSIRSTSQHQVLAQAATAFLDVAANEEEFPAVQETYALARKAALKARRLNLVALLDERHERIHWIAKLWQESREAKEALEATPEDPTFNLATGRYLCFARGDWKRGMEYLACCGDALLKPLAERELAASTDEETAIALGDAWWNAAEARDGWEQDAIRHRAAFWYRQAPAGQLTGLTKLQVEKRLEQVAGIPIPWETTVSQGAATPAHVTLRLKAAWEGHKDSVTVAEFSPDGGLLATGGGTKEQHIRLWDVASGKHLRTLTGIGSWVPNAAFSPDGTLFAVAAGSRNTIHIWQVDPSKHVSTLTGHSDTVRSVIFTPDGKQLISCADDRTIRVWDPHFGTQIESRNAHKMRISNLTLSPDGAAMATASTDGTVKIWDRASLKVLKTLQADGGTIWKLAFSPDGRTLATSAGDSQAVAWDVESGECRWTFPVIGRMSQGGRFSFDGRWLLVTCDSICHILDTERGTELAQFRAHTGFVRGVNFSPDGKTLVTGGQEGLIKLWSVETWNPNGSRNRMRGK